MNRSGLVEHLVKNKVVGSRADGERVVAGVLSGLEAGLKKDGAVQIPGFMTVKTAKRKARTGVNPKTKEKIKIPAGTVVRMRAGSRLKVAGGGKAPAKAGKARRS